MPALNARPRSGGLPRLADGIDRVSGALGKTVGYAAVLGSVGLMFYEVIARYVFDSPTRFTLEVGLMLQIVTLAAAAAYVLRENGHVEIELITERLAPRARAWAGVFQSACGVAVCGIFASQVWKSASWSAQVHKLTLDMEQPIAPLQYFLFAGFALLGLQFAVRGLRFYLAARAAAAVDVDPGAADESGP